MIENVTLNPLHRMDIAVVIIRDSMYANLISGPAESARLIRPHENPAPRVGELVNWTAADQRIKSTSWETTWLTAQIAVEVPPSDLTRLINNAASPTNMSDNFETRFLDSLRLRCDTVFQPTMITNYEFFTFTNSNQQDRYYFMHNMHLISSPLNTNIDIAAFDPRSIISKVRWSGRTHRSFGQVSV